MFCSTKNVAVPTTASKGTAVKSSRAIAVQSVYTEFGRNSGIISANCQSCHSPDCFVALKLMGSSCSGVELVGSALECHALFASGSKRRLPDSDPASGVPGSAGDSAECLSLSDPAAGAAGRPDHATARRWTRRESNRCCGRHGAWVCRPVAIPWISALDPKRVKRSAPSVFDSQKL